MNSVIVIHKENRVISEVVSLLGDKISYYLDHTCRTIDESLIHIPSPDTIGKVWVDSDRNIKVLSSLQTPLGHGRLTSMDYVSIFPVDQDVKRIIGALLTPNLIYSDSENIVKLAIEGGYNAVAFTLGILGSVVCRYAHEILFVAKLNHNEPLTYPSTYDQALFGTVKEAWNAGAVVVEMIIYFGSEQGRHQLVEIAEASKYAHEPGMVTILWCYLRNSDFRKGAIDYHAATDLIGQADRSGVIIKADIVKQKLPTNNDGFKVISFGEIDGRTYMELTSEHPVDLRRYQVVNSYMGRAGLINSGRESHGASDLRDVAITAVVNKRVGGMGLVNGRKASQKPMNKGVELLNAIQDVYLNPTITIAQSGKDEK